MDRGYKEKEKETKAVKHSNDVMGVKREKPPKRKEEKEPQYNLAQNQELADKMVEVFNIVREMDLAHLKHCLEGLREKISTYGSFGVMFDPMHMDSKKMLHEQAEKRLRGLISIREALDKYNDAVAVHMKETDGQKVIKQLFGLG